MHTAANWIKTPTAVLYDQRADEEGNPLLREGDRLVLLILRDLIFRQGGAGDLSRCDLETATGKTWPAIRQIRGRLVKAGYLEFEETADLFGGSAPTRYKLLTPNCNADSVVYASVDAAREARGEPTMYDRRTVEKADPDGSLREKASQILLKVRERMHPVKLLRRLMKAGGEGFRVLLDDVVRTVQNGAHGLQAVFGISVGWLSRSSLESSAGASRRSFSCAQRGGQNLTPPPESHQYPPPQRNAIESTRARSTTEVSGSDKNRNNNPAAVFSSAEEQKAADLGVLEVWRATVRRSPQDAAEALRVVAERGNVRNPAGLFTSAVRNEWISRETIERRRADWDAQVAEGRREQRRMHRALDRALASAGSGINDVKPTEGAFGASAVGFTELFGATA